jgi:C4-type Zn-finger protein
MKDYCVELKVCEGCGALFLRTANHGQMAAQQVPHRGGLTAAATTCRGCALRLSEFPAPRERQRRGFELRSVRRCERACAGVGGAR